MKLNPRELIILQLTVFSLLSLALIKIQFSNSVVAFVFYFLFIKIICEISEFFKVLYSKTKKCTSCKFKDSCTSPFNRDKFIREKICCSNWRWDKK